ncbi:hypothetical protein Phou_020380 [Phytohabitans houttuyneae]|uniref:Uncharacterized protein n=1 Tax=Phytohabitans houttuyneae TaxID=1076126 RepID=A0A6V8K6D4_9ACTN|nr:hypothetical protein Phou_020380 [Phytohabitans houttuyneae]
MISSAPSGMRFGGTCTAGPAAAATANPAGVDDSNSARTDTRKPWARSRSTSVTASSECPPRAKKLSPTPTDSSPSTCANAAHRISSCTVAGPRPAPACAA